jgi:MFS family permease
VLVLGLAPGFLVAFLAIAVFGTGNALEDASGFTLMPRVVGPRLAGPALGAFELVVLVGLGAGSLTAPALAENLGVRDALVLLGAALGVVTLAYVYVFARVDRDVRQPPAGAELLRGLPMFAPLPLVVVDDLADQLEERHYDPGVPVVVQGRPGERYHLVTEGTAAVQVDGAPRRTLGPGDGFGEIALLRDVPRTATVTARTALTTLSLDRNAFLFAVTMNQASRAQAEALVAGRLAEDSGTVVEGSEASGS